MRSESLQGTLHIIPFRGGSLAKRVTPIYQDLLRTVDNDVRDVLVLKRLPNGVPEFTTTLRDELGLQARPNVKSIARHASTVLEEAQPSQRRLSYEERIEFLATVLRGQSWSEYFSRAQEHDSFGSDVGQLLLEATWQGGFDLPTEETEYTNYLSELSAVNDSFHDQLAQRDLIEQADTIPQAIEALEGDEIRQHIEREFDTVLAVEFEEFSAVEREYLASLTANANLVCVGERYASVERVKKEAGELDQISGSLEIIDHTDSSVDSSLSISESTTDLVGQPFAQLLARGSLSVDDTVAPARLIQGHTLDRQVERVANEIEHLRHTHGWTYDDFAVLLRDVGDPMPRVRRVLQHSGIPTASAGVNGLEKDLAVRELHALAQYYLNGDEDALELLHARVSGVNDDLIQECVVDRSIPTSLKQWIVTTNLKGRIADESEDLDAREQFRNVSRLMAIADFVDSQDFLDSSWSQFTTMLERAITYDAPYAHTADVEVPEGGVTLGDVALLKNDSKKAVFLLNVVDSEYPGNETLSPLFPTTWIKRMPGYPAVSQPTEDDVVSTFPTVESAAGNEFERYHDERARRQLAIGARAAGEQLYFCTYERPDLNVDQEQHKSRYLHELLDHPELSIEEVNAPGKGSDRDIHTLGSASAEILAQPWAELERVQAEASTGGEVALESAEETLAEIQKVLAEREDVNPRFRQAVETQFDFARGAIRPRGEPSSTGGESDD